MRPLGKINPSPFADSAVKSGPFCEIGLNPLRHRGRAAVLLSYESPEPIAYAAPGERPHAQIFDSLAAKSLPFATSRQMPRVRPHLKMHQIVAAFSVQHHPAILGHGFKLFEKPHPKRIARRFREPAFCVVPSLEGPQIIE